VLYAAFWISAGVVEGGANSCDAQWYRVLKCLRSDRAIFRRQSIFFVQVSLSIHSVRRYRACSRDEWFSRTRNQHGQKGGIVSIIRQSVPKRIHTPLLCASF
jgi:hypothetical protein